MKMSEHTRAEALVPASVPTAEVLAEALASEGRLIEELINIMRRQRSAVAVDDLQGVDDSVFATHRVLVTLGEARRRRRTLNRMLGEREDISIDALDDVLGPRMTDALRSVRETLQLSAQALSREVALNRQVLRKALASGDAYVRTLAGVPAAMTYGARSLPMESAPPGGTLINRRA
jgi:hypothetical protein